MKQLAIIGIVAVLLIGSAVFLKMQSPSSGENPMQRITTTTPTTLPVTTITPTAAGSVVGTLTLNAALSNGYLSENTANDVFTTIDVTANETKFGERPRLNIALVIDRSGSMRGEKLYRAKLAANALLNTLKPNDRISLVTYATDVRVDVSSRAATPAGKAAFSRAVSNIRAGGGTNISGGFSTGTSQIGFGRNTDTVNRVILVSDGRATKGMKQQYQLTNLAKNARASSISVSTIGVGLDYNEFVMTGMAKQGSGNYYFVDNPSQTQTAISTEMATLDSVVARNANVVLTLRDGVVMNELSGFPYQRSGQKVSIALAEFSSGEAKNLLVKLTKSPSAAGLSPILDIALTYDDVSKKTVKNAEVALSALTTVDAAKIAKNENTHVIGRLQQVEIADAISESMVLYERGEGARAAGVLRRTRKTLKKRQKKYEFANEEAYDRAATSLDSLVTEVDAAPASSARGNRAKKAAGKKSYDLLKSSKGF